MFPTPIILKHSGGAGQTNTRPVVTSLRPVLTTPVTTFRPVVSTPGNTFSTPNTTLKPMTSTGVTSMRPITSTGVTTVRPMTSAAVTSILRPGAPVSTLKPVVPSSMLSPRLVPSGGRPTISLIKTSMKPSVVPIAPKPTTVIATIPSSPTVSTTPKIVSSQSMANITKAIIPIPKDEPVIGKETLKPILSNSNGTKDNCIPIQTTQKKKYKPEMESKLRMCSRLMNFQSVANPALRAGQVQIQENGEVAQIDGVVYVTRDGLTFVDCPVCGRYVGLPVLGSHLRTIHRKEQINCFAEKCVAKGIDVMKFQLHLLNSHGVFQCVDGCGMWLYVHEAADHDCDANLSMGRNRLPKDIELDTFESSTVSTKASEQEKSGFCIYCHKHVAKLKLHLRNTHMPKITCKTCRKPVPRVAFQRHMNKAHGGEQLRKCLLCGALYKKLRPHLVEAHDLGSNPSKLELIFGICNAPDPIVGMQRLKGQGKMKKPGKRRGRRPKLKQINVPEELEAVK